MPLFLCYWIRWWYPSPWQMGELCVFLTMSKWDGTKDTMIPSTILMALWPIEGHDNRKRQPVRGLLDSIVQKRIAGVR